MKNYKKYLPLLLALLIVGACEQYKLPEIAKPTTGTTVSFAKMVSVGNSLTAGFMNGALYTAGQNNSWTSILAGQMKLAGGGNFNQPDINSVNGYYGVAGTTILGRLYLKGTTSPAPAPKIPGDLPTAFTGDKAQLNNFGVPGITIQTAQLAALGGPSSGNPLYQRFASNPGTSTVLGDAANALKNGGTFFTFWLGNNDVLGYATGGASNPAILTSNATFTAAYNTAINAMLSANTAAYGAVANIPDVTAIPFFTTVAYNAIPLDAATAAVVSSGFAGYNQAMQGVAGALTATPQAFGLNSTTAAPIIAQIATRLVTFTASKNNKILIADETLVNMGPFFDGLLGVGAITADQRTALTPYQQVRQATASDLICLTAGSILGTTVGGNPSAVNGVSVPLNDSYVLLPSEIAEVKERVTSFNNTIKAAVDASNGRLVLVDAFSIFSEVAKGTVLINGSAFTASITPPNGGFSLDGVHPNARGYGFVANKFIEAINAKWGSTIPLCNPNSYPGNEFPIP